MARLLMEKLPILVGSKVISIDDLLSGLYTKACQEITVTAATDGNHGRSVAWGAQMFGCKCVIFINAAVSYGREKAIAELGAEVRRNPGSFDAAVRVAQNTAAEALRLAPAQQVCPHHALGAGLQLREFSQLRR